MDTSADKERVVIRWNTRDKQCIEAIRKRFGIPQYTTINGFTPAEISLEDMPVLKETSRRGFIDILHKKWCKNGGSFSF